MKIERDHPLRQLLGELVWRHFFADAQLHDPRVAQYVSDLLTDFTHVDNLYRIRDATGKPLEDVGEMLVESNPLLWATSLDREREVRKHIGDYVMFMTGLFPEYVASARRRRLRLDAFVDYVKAGKESYTVVSSFDQFAHRGEARLFRSLANNFELCVFGLNLVKQELEQLRREPYLRLKKTLEGPATA